MDKIGVKVKRLTSNAVLPKYAKYGDAGMDLTAITKAVDITVENRRVVTYGTGIAYEIPQGHVGLLFPRSSNSKYGQTLTNCVGVIDSGYRGEIMFKYKTDVLPGSEGKPVHSMFEYETGDRVGQIVIMPYPAIEIEEVDELTETDRGTGGFGSTGK